MTAPVKPPQPKPCPECGTMMQPVILEQLLHETSRQASYTCASCGYETHP